MPRRFVRAMSVSFDGSELQVQLPFLAGGIEAALLVEVEDGVDHLVRVVDDADQLHIGSRDGAVGHQRVVHPVQQALPEGRAHQNDRNAPSHPGLDQREHLHQFVQRAPAAGRSHEGGRVLGKGHLAREEVPEVQGHVLIGVVVRKKRLPKQNFGSLFL